MPWQRQVHLNQVSSDVEDEHIQDTDDEGVHIEPPQIELDSTDAQATTNVTMATLSSYPNFHAFRLKGTI